MSPRKLALFTALTALGLALPAAAQKAEDAGGLTPSFKEGDVISRKDFFDVIKHEPATAVKLLWSFVQVLGQRLRKTTSDLADARHGDRITTESEEENLFQD